MTVGFLPIVVNEVLLEHSHAHLLIPWLLSYYRGRVE